MTLLLLALGCSGEPAAPATPTPPTPPAAPAAATPAAPTVWTVDNVDQLVPAAPPRTTSVGKPLPALPEYDAALTTLGAVVERYAGDPDNPWAIAHGVLARGPEFRLSDGRPAVPHLFSTYAEPRTAGTRTLLGFPRSLGKIRVEPHTDLLLKNLAEVGVAPDGVYPTRAGEVPIADLYRHTLLKTFLVAEKNRSSFDDPNDMPWGLQALATWAPADELQWVATDGTPMDLDALTSFAVAVLTKESGFMFVAMQNKQSFERKGQGLFNLTCGGAHMVQGVSYAVARGFGTPQDRKAIELQAPLLFYRLPIELAIYDDALKRAPKFRTKLLVQRMKFLGHWLETTGKMQAMGLFVPDDAQMKVLEGAAQQLTLTVEALKKAGVFDNLDTLREQDEQLYLDVVGDASHAVRGLDMALGRGTIGW